MGNIVVAGGGMCGLAAAMVLADDGHDVVVLERDEAGPPADPAGAFHAWDRRSIAQFSLAHWLHARGTSIMERQLPAVHSLLAGNGGFRFNLVKYLLSVQPGATVEPDDDRFDQLTGRRSTLEWAMATAADAHAGVTVRRGVAIAGLSTGPSVADGVPHVNGVRLASGDVVPADVVIDATGRRSPTPTWLAEIGAPPPDEQAEDSGFAYYGRYYRSTDGSTPAIIGPLLGALGSFSVLTLPADNGTWSVTLYGLADDKALRRFRDPEVYERVVRACPLQAHWLQGEPINDVVSMAGIVDRHRRFVVDGRPCATGLLTVGDASSCTNPSLGRGITFGLMHVEVLRAAVAAHLDDPLELALDFHRRTETELRPWHDATRTMDRRRVREMQDHIAGRTPEVDPASAIGDALVANAGTDAVATRSFGDIFSCLATAEEVFARPGVFEHIIGLAGTAPAAPLPGPDRAQLLALVS